jgi:hypothetical protein
MLKNGMIVAYTADSADKGTDQDEGSYYLALIKASRGQPTQCLSPRCTHP